MYASGPRLHMGAERKTPRSCQDSIAAPQRPISQTLTGYFGANCRHYEERLIQGMPAMAAIPEVQQVGVGKNPHQVATALKVGSCGSVTPVSRSQPSFSSLMCSMAIALALASKSGIAWYSEIQQR